METGPRATSARFQTAARGWATLAVASLALPSPVRAGWWLPLHLALAGAVTTAISGAMQNFTLSLTGTPAPSRTNERLRLLLLGVGVTAIGVGFPSRIAWLVALGGLAFGTAMLLLLRVVLRARQRSVHRRHHASLTAYTLAVAAVLLGGVLGALLGSQVLPAAWWVPLRRTHLILNVLGFGSLTVAGTLFTFLPTLLRVRIPHWRSGLTITALAAGPLLLIVGAWGWAPALVPGAVVEALGAASLVAFGVSAARRPRTFAAPTAALHAGAAMVWFFGGAVAIALGVRRGPVALETSRTTVLIAFVLGWLVQVLLGAWGYLLPMARPGHPDERRRQLAVAEVGGRTQVAVYNAGLLAFLVGASGGSPAPVATAGAAAALAAGSFALAKAWMFAPLARGPLGSSRRAVAVWGEERGRGSPGPAMT